MVNIVGIEYMIYRAIGWSTEKPTKDMKPRIHVAGWHVGPKYGPLYPRERDKVSLLKIPR